MSESILWSEKTGGGRDKVGKIIPDHYADPVKIDRCLVAPTRSEDLMSMTRDGEVLAWDVFIKRRHVDVRRGDRVTIRGEVFIVEAMPFQWVPERRVRANHGTRFTAVRQEG